MLREWLLLKGGNPGGGGGVGEGSDCKQIYI